ncbi:hypothetical protein BZZ01_04710 [Nostocales cyanobacterium HT-58-2]|nr:hypothetical protein BZZ01_04710 [Nostocales cyanobacterium HT-58-2]
MSEFKTTISLLTPASDIIFASSLNYEAAFGRRGSDTFYGAVSNSSNNQSQNIDFWFGDIFDNSPEEYEIVLSIEQGNPLLILDRDIPSVGADRFILGDEYQPYYTNSGSSDALLTTDFLGLNEYVVIYDFSPTQDTIFLNGSAEDYRLVDINGLKVEGVEQLFYGKAIFSVQQGLPDLVAYVISKPEVKLDFKDEYFQFVGKESPKKPEYKEIVQFGTTGTDFSTAAATDASGNVYVTGYTTGSLEGTANGSSDIWVTKFDNNGNRLWGKQFGTSTYDEAYSVVTDKEGNFYLAGATDGNLFSSKQSDELEVWVAKYDSNGKQLWGKQFGTEVTDGYSSNSSGLDVDQAGNVYLSGLSIKENTRRDILNFPIQDDSWIIKFDKDGNQQWFTQLGKNTPLGNFVFDETYDVTVDKDGNTYAVGWTQGLLQESDPSRPLLKYDAWLTKVNPKGEVEWIQQFSSKNQGLEVAWAVDADSMGNIYVTGWTSGDLGTQISETNKLESNDIWLAKFHPDGTQEWIKQFGTSGDDGSFLADIEIDAKDNIYLTGYSNNSSNKDNHKQTFNAFVAKFDTSGTNQWIQQLGSESKLTYATGLATDDTGKLFVTGFTDASLGTSNTGANGLYGDAWLAILDAEKGNLQFTGLAQDVLDINNSSSSTVDITNNIETNEPLSGSDNITDPRVEFDKNFNPFSYGQLSSKLGDIFSPDSQNSFASVLSEGVANGNTAFLY